MSQRLINIGQSANDRKGDPLRTAMSKINDNFTELFGASFQFKRIVVPVEQWSNSFTTPVILIDSPGPNKYNMILQLNARWQQGATPWVNESLLIKTGALISKQLQAMINSAFEVWQTTIATSQGNPVPNPINQPTILTTLNQNNPSGGVGGTITLYIVYMVVDA